MKKVIIIGGVAGGASCAARLRRLDEACQIVLLERGKYISYANCGLPYHIGNVIKSGRALLLQTPEMMKSRYNIDVRVEDEALAIDPEARTITILNKKTGETYCEAYDELVIATGSSPVKLPLPGADSPKVFTLWTVDDAINIRKAMKNAAVKSAAVIGGGFIGLEVAENLREEGFEVSVIEMQEQLFPPFDPEMAKVLHSYMEEHGLRLQLSEAVEAFEDKGNSIDVCLKSGKVLSCGLVIMSAGVKPNSALAKNAGLKLNSRGGIVVDEHLRSSAPHIYAVGDVIVDDASESRPLIPLAAPANKQGRIVADNIAGMDKSYDSATGSSVIKMFDYTVAATGINEKTLRARGLRKGVDYQTVTVTQNDHAGYYPGASSMFLKLIFSCDGKKIYGAQIAGKDGVDKRIDTIGTAMALGAGVDALETLDFAYSPPYSSAKDPVNMAGFTAKNLIDGLVAFSEWDEVCPDENTVLLDIRESAEVRAFALPGAVHIPLGQLRERLAELDRSKSYIVFCTIGVRAYNAARILMQSGFDKVKVYPAGVRFYHTIFGDLPPVSKSGLKNALATEYSPAAIINCCGLACPAPVSEIISAMDSLKAGEVLEVMVSTAEAVRDIANWCGNTGNLLLGKNSGAAEICVYIRKSL